MGEMLGDGPWRTEGMADRSKKFTRAKFLERVQALVPDVLRDLKRDVLPEFQAHLDLLTATAQRLQDYPEGDEGNDTIPVSTTQVYSVLLGESQPDWVRKEWRDWASTRDALCQWAEAYNLTSDWILEAAASTLGFWSWLDTADLEIWYAPYFNRSSPLFPEEKEFRFRHAGWDMETQSRPEIREEIAEKFKSELTAYIDQAEAIARERGWSLTPTKYGSSNPLRHFDWLVRYQVQGHTKSKIAKDEHASRTTVRDGIDSIAKLIILDLREPSTGGRPIGS